MFRGCWFWTEIFKLQNNFQLAFFHMGAAWLRALEPLMEHLKKESCFLQSPHVYSAIRDAEIGEQVHVVFEAHNECDR